MVLNPDNLTAATRAALAQLRAPGSLHWASVYLLILTGYLYSSEIHAGRLRVVAAGAAAWFADWINEIINSGVLHWTGVAALWTETGSTTSNYGLAPHDSTWTNLSARDAFDIRKGCQLNQSGAIVPQTY